MMWGQKALHPLSEPTPFNCDMGWLIEIFDNTLPRIEAVFFFICSLRYQAEQTSTELFFAILKDAKFIPSKLYYH